jgi:rare lipoprotein A
VTEDTKYWSRTEHKVAYRDLVKATYYAKGFEGRKMADGLPFYTNRFSAASNRFMIGTTVRVTCVGSGRSINVMITDRPARGTGNIDLSQAAFKALGLRVTDGWGWVSVEPIYPTNPVNELVLTARYEEK